MGKAETDDCADCSCRICMAQAEACTEVPETVEANMAENHLDFGYGTDAFQTDRYDRHDSNQHAENQRNQRALVDPILRHGPDRLLEKLELPDSDEYLDWVLRKEEDMDYGRRRTITNE